MARGRPKICGGSKLYSNEQVGKLDACSQRTPKLEYSVAVTESSEDANLVCHELLVIRDVDVDEGCMRLGGEAMNLRANRRVQSVVVGTEQEFSLRILLGQPDFAAHSAKACQAPGEG
eukprot:2917578-Prymnesium_polylepis.1